MNPGQLLGPYRVASLLGRTGMGEVYLAEDTRLDRRVAIKVLPAEAASNPDRLERFLREARAASALNHPNVATIYDIGEAHGIHFIAMEHVEGQTLAKRIAAGPLELDETIRIAEEIAGALSAAHEKAITHRDIKPANIIVTPAGHVKVLDFGLAKMFGPKPDEMRTIAGTEAGVVMGTLEYMSCGPHTKRNIRRLMRRCGNDGTPHPRLFFLFT